MRFTCTSHVPVYTHTHTHTLCMQLPYSSPHTARPLLSVPRFASLLKNVYEASSSYLPGSMKRLRFEQELLMVLWKLLDENPGFRDYVLRVQDVNKLVTPMLYLMYEGKDDPAKVGLIHMCTFILLLLSGERNFGVALNQPYTESLPVDLPRFSGTHGDLLFIVLHKLFVSGASRLSTLYSSVPASCAPVRPSAPRPTHRALARCNAQLLPHHHGQRVAVHQVAGHGHRGEAGQLVRGVLQPSLPLLCSQPPAVHRLPP